MTDTKTKSEESLRAAQWTELRKPFAKEAVGVLPKPYKRESPKGDCNDCGGYHGLPAAHLDYVGHAAVTDRLNNVVGPENWNWEPLAVDEFGFPKLDRAGNLWIKLRVFEVTRLGYGDGSTSIKELIGDALRNAGMRFGIALDLWTKDELESNIVPPPPKAKSPAELTKDAIKTATDKLEQGGVSTREEKVKLILRIAGVDTPSALTFGAMQNVIEVIDTNPVSDLREFYLSTDSTDETQDLSTSREAEQSVGNQYLGASPKSNDVDQGPVDNYRELPDDVDLVEAAAQRRQADSAALAEVFHTPRYIVPTFPKGQSSKLIPLAMTKQINLWITELDLNEPEIATLMHSVANGKDRPTTWDEAHAVLEALAEELNLRQQALAS